MGPFGGIKNFRGKSLTMTKKSTTKHSLSSNNKSYKTYGTQSWYPLEAPEIAF